MTPQVELQDNIYDDEILLCSIYKVSGIDSEEEAMEFLVEENADEVDIPEGYEIDRIEVDDAPTLNVELLPLLFWLYFFRVYWKLKK